MSAPGKQDKYWNPYVGGALLGILLFMTFFLTGHGLGSSGGMSRIMVALEDVVVPEHVPWSGVAAARVTPAGRVSVTTTRSKQESTPAILSWWRLTKGFMIAIHYSCYSG